MRRGGSSFLAVAIVALGLATVPAAAAPSGNAPITGRPGQLDPTFAGGTLVAQPMVAGWNWGEGMAVQPDGKIVVVGAVNSNGQYSSFDGGIARFNANGTLDTGFANGGKLIIDRSGQYDEATGVVAQPDGKVIVVGSLTPAGTTDHQGFVLRLLANGTPDPSFQGGTALLPPNTDLRDVALQPDGKVVVSGGWMSNDMLVARLNADGSLDTAFGTGGISTPGVAGAKFDGETVALTTDGRIIVAGSLYWSQYSDAAMARFSASGVLDPSFGDGGLVRTTLVTPTLIKGAIIDDLVIDPQGRPVLAGEAMMFDDGSEFHPFTATDTQARRWVTRDVLLLRFLPDGRLDPSFSGDGKSLTPIPSQLLDPVPPGLDDNTSGMSEQESFAKAVAIDPEGRIMVAGAAAPVGSMPSIMRFTAGGILDPTFGSGGLSTVTMSAADHTASAWFGALALLPDGRILAAGNWNDATHEAFIIARFLPQTGRGAVWAWGWNGVGQLGDGTTTDHIRPASVPDLSDVVAVSAGAYHTLALKGDGTVWAWGWNYFGQVGDGTTVDRARPVRVPGLTGVVAISAGAYHSLALLGDGTVRAWGWNYFGQLGDGTTVDRASPVAVANLGSVLSIAAGGLHSLAVVDNGSVWGWGSNVLGQLADGTTQDRLTPVKANYHEFQGGFSYWQSRVGAGMFHSLSLATQPSPEAWGWDGYGQLGPAPGADPRTTPTLVAPPFGVMRVAGGGLHTLLLTDRGLVYGFGSNGLGQAGIGTFTDRAAVPAVPIAGLTAREVAAGIFHNLAVASDGTVRAWGWNGLGQLGDGTTTTRSSPVVVAGLTRAFGVAAGATHSVAIVLVS